MTSTSQPNPAPDRTDAPALWPCFAFSDVPAMTRWLTAIGFTEEASYTDESGTVVHAEWVWRHGGGIMFGQHRADGGVSRTGTGATYLFTPEPDAVFDAALAAGGTVVRPMVDQDYGGRGGTVTDPEGNDWSVGSYRPS